MSMSNTKWSANGTCKQWGELQVLDGYRQGETRRFVVHHLMMNQVAVCVLAYTGTKTCAAIFTLCSGVASCSVHGGVCHVLLPVMSVCVSNGLFVCLFSRQWSRIACRSK